AGTGHPAPCLDLVVGDSWRARRGYRSGLLTSVASPGRFRPPLDVHRGPGTHLIAVVGTRAGCLCDSPVPAVQVVFHGDSERWPDRPACTGQAPRGRDPSL